MLVIDNSLISDDLKHVRFICDLKACCGACCVEGDAGAPLEEEEISILEDIVDSIKSFMSPEGVKVVEKEGVFVYDSTGDSVTPLINEGPCAYAFFDENHIASCAIERAYEAKAIEFRKPISCHLYPVRLSKIGEDDIINYHKWHVCEKAVTNGKKQDIYLYEFLKEALIRRFGKDWYDELTELIEEE